MNAIEQELSQIPHFQFIHEHLLSSAQPSLEQIQHIKAYGVDTLINLALSDTSTSLQQQDQHCLDLGLNYIQVPIDCNQPAVDQCLFVLDLIDYLVKDKIVWLHCSDYTRASSLIYVYRQYYMDMDLPTAQQLLHDIWEPNDTWTGVLHALTLQLQGRKATQDLQQSLQHSSQQALQEQSQEPSQESFQEQLQQIEPQDEPLK